jgi:hypothetical protein
MHRRLSSVLLRIAAVVIAALHAGLLWQRIEDLSITDPAVLARWCAAALAAAAGLLLLHLRVSWRSWVVFWTVIVLLHAAAPMQQARLDVFIEAVFALAPLILLAASIVRASQAGPTPLAVQERFALPVALLATSLPCRAPPHR